MKSVSVERVTAPVSAVVLITLLILGLSVPKSGSARGPHSQAIGHECITDINSRPRIQPFIHDMISTAVSITDRL